MAQKYKIVKQCQSGECVDDYREVAVPIYFCDICKVEMTQEVYFENGGRITLIKGTNRHKYELYLEVCASCITQLLKVVESEKVNEAR